MAALDPNSLADLAALARAGSLHTAAKRRGVAVSTLSRRLASLEQKLGLPLVDRRARGSRLTEAGERLAELAMPLDDQLARIERGAAAFRTGASSVAVRVSATEAIVSDVLAPALPKLWRSNAINVELRSQSDVVSLASRDADLAIRMVRPQGASLVMRRLPALALAMFASSDYLAGRSPDTVELSRERLLLYDESFGRIPEVALLASAGLEAATTLRTGSTRALLTACHAGAGIALLPIVLARAHPALVQIRVPFAIPPREPWLVVHPDVRRNPAVRAVQRWVVETFAALGSRVDAVRTRR